MESEAGASGSDSPSFASPPRSIKRLPSRSLSDRMLEEHLNTMSSPSALVRHQAV